MNCLTWSLYSVVLVFTFALQVVVATDPNLADLWSRLSQLSASDRQRTKVKVGKAADANDANTHANLHHVHSRHVQPLSVDRLTELDSPELPARVAYTFSMFDIDVDLQLQKNVDLFASGYKTFHQAVEADGSESQLVEVPSEVTGGAHCWYHGYVGDDLNSTVAVSLCNGLKGIIRTHDDFYAIEPLPQQLFPTPTNASASTQPQPLHARVAAEEHVVYKLSSLAKKERDTTRCGHEHGSSSSVLGEISSRASALLTSQLASTPEEDLDTQALGYNTKYIELLVINDNYRYSRLGARTEYETANIVNYIAQFYKFSSFDVSISIVLSSQITWTQGNPMFYYNIGGQIETQGSNGLLTTFHNYLNSNAGRLPKFDNVQLYSGMQFKDGIVGLAGVGTLCSGAYSSAVCQMTRGSDPLNALVCGHELGHNLGMQHDGISNSCPTSGSIMAPYAGSAVRFSSCSIGYFRQFMNTYRPTCMDNVPVARVQTAVCGNGIVEDGETCDCGSNDCSKSNPCCDGATCQANKAAPCSPGDPCCTNRCEFVSASTRKVCRPAQDDCDEPDYCTGQSGQCGANTKRTTGFPCHDITNKLRGACFNGKCMSQANECASRGAKPCDAPSKSCKALSCSSASASSDASTSGRARSRSALVSGPFATQCAPLSPTVPVADGVRCGLYRQCLDGECVSSGALDKSSNNWFIGEWSACSATCGGGTRSRTVQCQSPLGQVLPTSACPAFRPDEFDLASSSSTSSSISVPASSQPCNTAPCTAHPHWQTSSWSTCSKACGGGQQKRNVFCSDGQSQLPESSCLGLERPSDSQFCNAFVCEPCSKSDGTTCSGHGMCRVMEDLLMPVCACDLGYTGSRCQIAPAITLGHGTQDLLVSNGVYSLRWNSTGALYDVSILLYREGESWPQYVARSLPNSGSFDWSIVSHTGPAIVQSGFYYLRVMFSRSVFADTPRFEVKDACALLSCSNHGKCVADNVGGSTSGRVRCQCEAGFDGDRCQTSSSSSSSNNDQDKGTITTNICATNPCANGGVCASSESESFSKSAVGPFFQQRPYQCTCSTGWTGPNCDIPATCKIECVNGLPNKDCTACMCQDITGQVDRTPSKTPKVSELTPPRFWSGARCDQCSLDCGPNGSPDASCTKCVCDRGASTSSALSASSSLTGVGWEGARCNIMSARFALRLFVPMEQIATKSDTDRFSALFLDDVARSLNLLHSRITVLSVESAGIIAPLPPFTNVPQHAALVQFAISFLDLADLPSPAAPTLSAGTGAGGWLDYYRDYASYSTTDPRFVGPSGRLSASAVKAALQAQVVDRNSMLFQGEVTSLVDPTFAVQVQEPMSNAQQSTPLIVDSAHDTTVATNQLYIYLFIGCVAAFGGVAAVAVACYARKRCMQTQDVLPTKAKEVEMTMKPLPTVFECNDKDAKDAKDATPATAPAPVKLGIVQITVQSPLVISRGLALPRRPSLLPQLPPMAENEPQTNMS